MFDEFGSQCAIDRLGATAIRAACPAPAAEVDAGFAVRATAVTGVGVFADARISGRRGGGDCALVPPRANAWNCDATVPPPDDVAVPPTPTTTYSLPSTE